jgi:glycosyltransferase involved in cell wall biosynthesis
MRIVLYNYAQPDEDEGGGVRIYQQNLANALTDLGHTVILLSSGLRYALGSSAFVRYRKDRFLRAEIVNSPVVAPAPDTFYGLRDYNQGLGLDHIPGLLRAEYGVIDVFHFQNLEGLTRRFFPKLRAAFPAAQMLYSVHNYNLVCPQVHLWFQDREVCVDFKDGEACTKCLVGFARRPHHRQVRPVEEMLVRRGLTRKSIVVRAARRATRYLAQSAETIADGGRRWTGKAPAPTADAAMYRDFRQGNIELCNEFFDSLLAVSERTRDQLIQRGVRPDRVAVSYIGTAHKQTFLQSVPIISAETLHLGYLGYVRRDKGFFFLLDALESLPEEIAGRMELTIAAATKEPSVLARLKALANRFKALIHHDGFTHDTLEKVLAPVNLGIVPVLWEDNLPQVAIEFVSHGIPIVTSDRGGAGEIANNPAFSFKAGDITSLHERLKAISTALHSLGTFWTQAPRIYSMEEHVAELMQFYRPACRAAVA